jgi:hypothetical protein
MSISHTGPATTTNTASRVSGCGMLDKVHLPSSRVLGTHLRSFRATQPSIYSAN